MFIVHIALQGCLKGEDVEYGKTADTGGHIKYLMELAEALSAKGAVRQDIVVRRFEDTKLGAVYGVRETVLDERRRIVRIDGDCREYLSKEELHRDHEALTASFLAYLRRLPDLPDVIHAHYADAGVLALAAKAAFGIPFVFTAHSLGRVKAEANGPAVPDPALRRRIDIEERTIEAASFVIASSRDEAELQYASYDNYRNERVRIIAPGCRAPSVAIDATCPNVLSRIEEVLNDPQKPVILAIARPVWKKNLQGLVAAFGGNAALRQMANLVIVAGTRTDLATETGEHADVVRDLLVHIDRYDLWGRVALPKTHSPDDIAHLYRFAKERRGVFTNPALNEPFGLTLLEAAAMGLPVVATANGGPRDIVGRLRNGVLVDPKDSAGIGTALYRLLSDQDEYERYRRAGLERVGQYSWDRFADSYLHELEGAIENTAPPRPPVPGQCSHLLVSDIDDTLVGCPRSLRTFGEWRRKAPNYCFAIATGRSLHGALEVLQAAEAPVPEVLVTNVGSEIYYTEKRDLRRLIRDEEWTEYITEDWVPARIIAALSDRSFLQPQAPMDQTPLKRSYFTTEPEDAIRVRRILSEHGLPATVIHSHDRFLDILPARASKGAALRWLVDKLGVPEARTLAAGDSGNDLEMLKDASIGIVVGNHKPELDVLRRQSGIYFAKASYAAGILEGVAAANVRWR